jgi:hypothetical protein
MSDSPVNGTFADVATDGVDVIVSDNSDKPVVNVSGTAVVNGVLVCADSDEGMNVSCCVDKDAADDVTVSSAGDSFLENDDMPLALTEIQINKSMFVFVLRIYI